MGYIFSFYLTVALIVYFTKYSDTPDEYKETVRKNWWKFYLRCLAWPIILLQRGGFKTEDR